MVTQYAKSSLDTLMTMSLQESLRTEANSEWGVKPIDNLESAKQKEFIMLTISSYEFRICILLHFSKDKQTTEYVANAIKMPADKLEAALYYDYLGEIGNTFVGAFKRELAKYFPHLGMSTPNRLVSSSLKFLKEFPFDYGMHIKASTDGGVSFYSSLYLSSNKDFDFRVENKESLEGDAEKGDLELF